MLDIGCGTGTFACLLAQGGVEVIGTDPAPTSLDVARRKPHADEVRWLHADAASVPSVNADLATMTGNVAQVFLSEEAWHAALAAARAALRPGGVLVFEVRNPVRSAWEGWTRATTHRQVRIPEVGIVRTWIELTEVKLPFVSFRHSFEFEHDGTLLVSTSTLPFRERDELLDSLRLSGFRVLDVRDAPDRPGLELVFIAERYERSET